MTDRYIDAEETLIYGPYASKKIRSVALGLLKPFDNGLEHLADEIDHATESMRSALEVAHAADHDVRKGVGARGPALAEGLDVLGRFSRHLEGHKASDVDRKQFFPNDGTAKGVGRSAPRVLLALVHVANELKKKTCPVHDKDAWRAEVTDAIARLSPVVEHADTARTERRRATPEMDAARTAWLQTYRAARAGVECVLRLSGKLDLMPTVFYDLAVPGGTKVTQAPAEPTGQPS